MARGDVTCASRRALYVMVTGSAAATVPVQVMTPPASPPVPALAHRSPWYSSSTGSVSVTRTPARAGPGFSRRMV